MNTLILRKITLVGLAGLMLTLGACGGNKNSGLNRISRLGSVPLGEQSAVATSVNKFLWAASLETVDFMPIASADPLGGVILSDWYANPQAPDERLKANIFILDDALRTDALRVTVFRQQRTGGGWIDAPVNESTARELENAILTKARQIRLNSDD